MMGQHLGFSFYSTESREDNLRRIERFSKQGIRYAFTSLNLMPLYDLATLTELMQACHQAGVAVMADVNATSLGQYGLERLKDWGFAALRVDDGLSPSQLAVLAEEAQIVLNASTLTEPWLMELQSLGVSLAHVWAAYNYYPKTYTGLSSEAVHSKNQELKKWGLPSLAFVCGARRRGPYYDGLCTVEETRSWTSQHAALHLLSACQVDRVYIGDCDVSDEQLQRLVALNEGIVEMKAVAPDCLLNRIWSNRPDASEWVIRDSQTRKILRDKQLVAEVAPRNRGDIVLAQESYGTYEKELEICLRPLPVDARQGIVGTVGREDWPLLDYIHHDWARFRFQKFVGEGG